MPITHRILYVDKVNEILTNGATANPSQPGLNTTTLKAWCVAKGITGIKWYCAGLETSSTKGPALRTLIQDMRALGIRDHQFVSSGSYGSLTYPGTYDKTTTPFGFQGPLRSDILAGSTMNTKRFFYQATGASAYVYKHSGGDLEYEFYNASATKTLTITSASGNGTTATLRFATQSSVPFAVGSLIEVTNISPSGYRTSRATVTAATTSSVSYANATTATMTASGQITNKPQAQTDKFNTVWKPRMENGMRGLYYSDLAGATAGRTTNANTAYLGWWSNVPQAPSTIVRLLTRLDLHDYKLITDSNGVPVALASYLSSLFGYTQTRIQEVASAQAAYAPTAAAYYSGAIGATVPKNIRVTSSTSKFEIFPIFSLESSIWKGDWISSTGAGLGPYYYSGTGATVSIIGLTGVAYGPFYLTGATAGTRVSITGPSGSSKNYWHLSPYQTGGMDVNFSGLACYSGTVSGYNLSTGSPIGYTGGNCTFDQLFNAYLTGVTFGSTGTTGGFRQWQAGTYTHRNWITEPDGYVLFAYSHAYASRPSTTTP